jgi:hypothetical protein
MIRGGARQCHGRAWKDMIHQLKIGKSPRPVGKNPLFKNPAKKELQEQDF